MKSRCKSPFRIVFGSIFLIVFAFACKTNSAGETSLLSANGNATDMSVVDKNRQEIVCHGEDNYSWTVSKTRKTIQVTVEGESARKKVTSRKATKSAATYTTSEGTLVVSPTNSTWTENGGQPGDISCDITAAPAQQPVVAGNGFALANNGKTVTCRGEDNYSWVIDAQRKKIKMTVEGESNGAQAIQSKKSDNKTQVAYTTSEGTLDLNNQGTTWTFAGESESGPIDCQ